jgi:hypothetical protein
MSYYITSFSRPPGSACSPASAGLRLAQPEWRQTSPIRRAPVESVVKKRSPLLAGKVEIEVLQRTESADGQTKSRRQPRGRSGIDHDPGRVRQDGRGVVADVVMVRRLSHPNITDLAAATTAMYVVGDDAWPLRLMRVKPRACCGIDLNNKVSIRGHRSSHHDGPGSRWQAHIDPGASASRIPQRGPCDNRRRRLDSLQTQSAAAAPRFRPPP